MNEQKIHILPDENLGGVLREFVEVDRAANVGDKIVITDPSDFQLGDNYTKGTVMTVTKADEYGGVYCGKFDLIEIYEYQTLEPTDIVRIKEKYEHGKWDYIRYRLIDRKAKVGEKVIIVEAGGTLVYKNVGEIVEIIGTDGDTYSGMIKPYDFGEKGAVYHFQYRVLEPLYTCDHCGKELGDNCCSNSTGGAYCSAKCANADEPQVEVDGRDASPKVIDMLGNLAQRIAKLEREFNEMEKALSSNQTRASRAEKKADLMQDEIDGIRKRNDDEFSTLHRNQKRIAEELETLKHEKSYTPSDLCGKTLKIYTGTDVEGEIKTTVITGVDESTGAMYVLDIKSEVIAND